MDDSILSYVLNQLELAKGRWAEISADTGISRRTIEKIASGYVADPGVKKIEILARYFHARSDRSAAV